MKAHELIEAIQNGKVEVEEDYAKSLPSDFDTLPFIEHINNSHKFLFSLDDAKKIQSNEELCSTAVTFIREGVYKLPFNKCLYEVRAGMGRRTILLCAQKDSFFVLSIFMKESDASKWRLIAAYIPVSADNEGAIFKAIFPQCYYEEDNSIIDYIKTVINFATNVPIAVQSKGIRINQVDAPEKLNKARTKKGKLPIFEYKTLILDGYVSASKSVGGGTHRSPRIHFRRGHIRTLSSGNRVPVNACVVGTNDNGVIMKDYEVKI